MHGPTQSIQARERAEERKKNTEEGGEYVGLVGRGAESTSGLDGGVGTKRSGAKVRLIVEHEKMRLGQDEGGRRRDEERKGEGDCRRARYGESLVEKMPAKGPKKKDISASPSTESFGRFDGRFGYTTLIEACSWS